MNYRMWLASVAIASAFATSSCTYIDVNALPQPGNTYRNGYDLILEFDNVLNLADHAKVVMNGTTVGVVTETALTTRHVAVTVRIDSDIAVPSDIQAILQQATVLGDTYVALDRPQPDQPAAPPLGPGSVVPLAQTTSPPPLEDTIANLANFVSSGSIQRIQNTIIGINRVTPTGDTARQIASQVSADLSDLSENMETVDQWLSGVSGTAAVMHNRIPTFQYWFSPKGMEGFNRQTTLTTTVAELLSAAGSVYNSGHWLVPLLGSLADAMAALQRDKQSFEAESHAWRPLFYEYFLPQDKHPAMNITSIIGPDGRELSGNVHDVLRIIGAAQ